MTIFNNQMDYNPTLTKKIKNITQKLFIKPSYPVLTFYLLLITGIACFIVTWLDTGFVVPLYGDYNIQMMTLIYDAYDDWHVFYETGHFIQWDRSVFIGIDNVGGNSFYYLFDPFMIIATWFPRDWLLVEQGVSFVLKMALGGMFFYWYLGEFKLSPRIKMIGAICFAFNGYIFQYLWFHFIEVETFFPLALLGVEKLIKKKDPRYLMVGFLLIGLCNYFFFVVYMLGAFVYWCFRYLQDIFRRTRNDNYAILGVSFFGFLIAVFMGCITLLPGMTLALNMPRVNNASYLSNILQAEGFKAKLDALLTYSYSFNKLTPIFNIIFAPNNCFYSNILPVYWYDNLSGSMYVTTPITILFFTSFIQSIKDRRISHIIGILLTCLLVFTPFGFYFFSGFTVGYARYFILPMSWMLTYSLITLSKRREISRTTFDLGFALAVLMMGICFILDLYYMNNYDSVGYSDGTNWDYRIYEIIITIVWAFVVYLVLRPLFHKRQFNAVMTFLCMVDVIAFANIVIYCQGYCDMSSYAGGQQTIKEETYIAEKLKESEGNDFYRIYSENQANNNININLREGFNGIGAFHSVYAFSAQDFLDRSRLPFYYHDWEMATVNQRYNMETFLGMKYYFISKDNFTYNQKDQAPDTYNNVPLGYKNIIDLTQDEMKELGVTYSEELLSYLKSDDCKKACYVNLNFIDTGFSFDEAIDTDWLYYKTGNETYNRYEDINEYPLLRYAMLDHDDYVSLVDDGVFTENKFHVNGVEKEITETEKNKQSNQFSNMLVSTSDYEENKSTPIQRFYGSSKVEATVYASNWPETERNATGEYLMDVVDGKNIFYDDAYDSNGKLIPSLRKWAKENPFLYKNGIYPADTKFDYYTKRKDDGTYYENGSKVYYNAKVVYKAVEYKYVEGRLTKTYTTFGKKIEGNEGYYISIDDTNNMDWRFYDENDNLIESARHPYHEYKRAHGYYSTVPVKTIVGVTRSGTKDEMVTLHSPSIYVQPYCDYLKAIKNLKDNAISIIDRNDDMVHFKTNYDKQRFVVLNYPNEKGWTIKEKVADSKEASGYSYKKVTTYKAQGGFVSFVAEKGEHEYILTYSNSSFMLGGMITALGSFITFVTICLMSRRKKEEGNPYVLSLKTGFENEILKEKWNYEDCQDLGKIKR